jgi:hypothetical protein
MPPRLTNAVLGNQMWGQYSTNTQLDLTNGGQQGYSTDFTTYVSNTTYTKRNLICLLLETPAGFNDLNAGSYWTATLKALVELHAKSISGLNSELTVDYVETAVGGAGEMQEDISNVTRQRSTPEFTWTEKYGKPIWNFFDGWIRNLLMDPISKVPAVVASGTNRPTDLLPDYTSASMIFIEPDPTHTQVVMAWLCTNMMPKTSGENTGRRDLTQAANEVDYSITFTALTQVGYGVNQFAQQLLDQINLTGANPNLRQAFLSAVSADVAAAEVAPQGNGYVSQIAVTDQENVAPTGGFTGNGR